MFLYTCIKKRILLFLPFGFSLRTSKRLFKQSLSLQKVLSLIRLNDSHNLQVTVDVSSTLQMLSSVSVKHRCVSVLHF